MPEVRHPCAAYKNGILIGKYKSYGDAAFSLGLKSCSIRSCIKGLRKSAKGYTFADIPNSEVPRLIENSSHKWLPTHIFPNEYMISDDGQLYSIRTDRILKFNIDSDGYAYYVLCVAGHRHTIKAHRLVAEAFIPNPDNKPALDHINGIRTDNRIENLHWVTNKENSHNPLTLAKLTVNSVVNIPKLQQASIDRNYGRREVAVYKDDTLLGIFESQHKASIFAHVSESKISMCLNGYKDSCKGYTFRRIDNQDISDGKWVVQPDD